MTDLRTMTRKNYQHLIPGSWYQIAKTFHDFDDLPRPRGTIFRYLGYRFLPYDDGLTLFVSFGDGNESTIRLQWRSGSQAEVLEDFRIYVEPVERGGSG